MIGIAKWARLQCDTQGLVRLAAKNPRLPRFERMALELADSILAPEQSTDTALLFCTNWGGLKSTADFFESIASRGAAYGSPNAFHQSVHHSAAGQVSIAHRLTGISLTLCARELSGFAGLRAAFDLLESGFASHALVICADEVTAQFTEALHALKSGLEPREHGAAVLLSAEAAALKLEHVELSSEPASLSRASQGEPTLDGLNSFIDACERAQKTGDPSSLVAHALGGGLATVRLSR